MRVPLAPLDFLERARRLFGSLEAAVDGERRFTYAGLADRAWRLAGALRSDLGVAAGDRVAWLCRTRSSSWRRATAFCSPVPCSCR